MLNLLKTTRANGAIFISGDRHWSELSALDAAVPYRLLDFTSSSFNQLHPRGTPTENRYRFFPQTFHKENFGVIDVDWDVSSPVLTLEIRDLKNQVRLSHRLTLSNLSP